MLKPSDRVGTCEHMTSSNVACACKVIERYRPYINKVPDTTVMCKFNIITITITITITILIIITITRCTL